jgi:hypothetical protein
LESRAEQNGIDFVNGVTTALTPMAYFEIVMLKAFETLIDPDATVDVATGMIAAGKLQALLPGKDGGSDLARLKAQVVQIGEAVRSTVPEEMWGQIPAKRQSLTWGCGPPQPVRQFVRQLGLIPQVSVGVR